MKYINNQKNRKTKVLHNQTKGNEQMTKTNAIEAQVATKIEVTAELLAQWDNTSKKIRGLSALGLKNGEIEKAFQAHGVTTKTGSPIRYQHIRNVLITPIGTSKGE